MYTCMGSCGVNSAVARVVYYLVKCEASHILSNFKLVNKGMVPLSAGGYLEAIDLPHGGGGLNFIKENVWDVILLTKYSL